jgi:hypothetical protein
VPATDPSLPSRFTLEIKQSLRDGASNLVRRLRNRSVAPSFPYSLGWEYDYHAQLAYQWPTGVNQVPALVGTVMRAKAHDGGAAGYVASFIAVRQP